MRLLLACVLLACVRRSTGWVTKTIGSSKFPMRWSVPESNEDVRAAHATTRQSHLRAQRCAGRGASKRVGRAGWGYAGNCVI